MFAEDHRQQALEHGNVHPLALASTLTVDQRGADCPCQLQSNDAVSYDQWRVARNLGAGLLCQPRNPAHALDEVVISRFACVGSALAEAERPDVDDAGIDLPQVLIPQAQALHSLRAQVVDQHIGGPGEMKKRVTSTRGLQVEHD